MRVFLSWSGKTSLKIARALRDWLPTVLQSLEPWLSSEDITKGARWASEISNALEASEVGIICLTRENMDSRWLNFEAGVIAKKIDASLLCVYLFDIEPADMSGPLSQFQCTRAVKEDTYQLLKSLNTALGTAAIPDPRLLDTFDVWWPKLENRFREILTSKSDDSPPVHTTQEVLEEILEIVRRLDAVPRTETQHPPSGKPPESEMPAAEEPSTRPRVFIGSSTEGLRVAETIQLGLDQVAECSLWTQGTFNLSQTTIESIVDASAGFDFAVLVLTPDDTVKKRGESHASARDNIIFELGLFTGALSRARTFMVFPRDANLELPSDLAGVTAATYAARSDGNLEAALGPVCTRIKKAMGVA